MTGAEKLWIQTYTGRAVDFTALRPEDVSIVDIAVALSRIPRFTGHTARPYSVAHHSLYCAEIVRPGTKAMRWVALLHDATEAYIGDVSSPLKRAMRTGPRGRSAYDVIEAQVYHAIALRFRLPAKLPSEVKTADLRALLSEKRDLGFSRAPREWGEFPVRAHPRPCLESGTSGAIAERFLDVAGALCPQGVELYDAIDLAFSRGA